jgi:hypothetical protein
MYFPSVNRSNLLRVYKVGGYIARVYGDIEASGLVTYQYLMTVSTERQPTPLYMVAAEHSAMLNEGDWVLGVFDGKGHANHGIHRELADVDAFCSAALNLVMEHFQIYEAPYEIAATDSPAANGAL